jgi:hypothetical protein
LWIGQARRGKRALALELSRGHEPPAVRPVIEVRQRVHEAWRRVSRNPGCECAYRRLQELSIRTGRLEAIDVERRREVICKHPLGDADRFVKAIVVEKAATATRGQQRLVAERCERTRQAVMESADALLEQEVGVRTETRAGQPGQDAEFGLPRAAAKDIDVQASGKTVLRRQQRLANRIDGKAIEPRVEHGFVLDHDDVGVACRVCGYRRQQRQRFFRDVADGKTSDLPPRQRIDQRSHEARVEAARLGCEAAESRSTATASVAQGAGEKRDGQQQDADVEGERRSGGVEQYRQGRQDRARGPCENRRDRARVFHKEKWDGAGKQQRQISDGELEPAVSVFDGRCPDDCRGKERRQQHGPLGIAEDDHQRGRGQTLYGKREREVFWAAFGKGEDADGQEADQSEDHLKELDLAMALTFANLATSLN